ncbi:MAG TPA: peptidylprolyl isomerase [Acidiferrobacteraceae bacterium]|mgnify:CR=1 FL=1|nr:peptidylprolyl isomerase [Acidiferrobacteraceae bacterium]
MTLNIPNPKVIIHTTYGPITVELFVNKVPKTVENFLQYVDDGFYINTLFHRVIDRFIVQGGGFQIGMVQKTTRPPITNEIKNGLRNEMATVAMARVAGDTHSATSQFFINTQDNESLNRHNNNTDPAGYCVFGKVLEGMAVIERIEGSPTSTHGEHENVPVQDIFIQLIERMN